MKKILSVFAAIALAVTSFVFVQPAKASQLEVMGATVTWDPATLFEPTGCSSFNFSYNNGTGIRLLQLEFQVKSRFGDSLIRESQIGIPAGTTGQWRVQVCAFELVDGLGPYSTELSIEDYEGTVRSATGSLSFLSRSGSSTPPATELPSQTGSQSLLEVFGATVTWDPATLFEPTGCSSFNFSYNNGTGIRLLQLEFQVKSRFGDSLIRESQIGIPAGTTGQWRVQVCAFELVDGRGPYSTELSIEDYDGTVRTATGSLSFVSRTASPPASTTPTAEFRGWTKAIANGSVKFYARGVIGKGKVSFRHNGREVAWVRASNGSDSKINLAGDGMVRTVRLNPGRNVLEIYVDGERVVRRIASN